MGEHLWRLTQFSVSQCPRLQSGLNTCFHNFLRGNLLASESCFRTVMVSRQALDWGKLFWKARHHSHCRSHCSRFEVCLYELLEGWICSRRQSLARRASTFPPQLVQTACMANTWHA